MSLETMITPADRVSSESESQESSETYIQLGAPEYQSLQTQYPVFPTSSSGRCSDLPSTISIPQEYHQPYTSQSYNPRLDSYMVPQSYQPPQPYQLNQSFYLFPPNPSGTQSSIQNVVPPNIKQEPMPDERKTPSTDEEGEINKKSKRKRTAYTTQQLFDLEQEFREHKYINRRRRAELSMALGVPDLKIKVWFQNRRMKDKKEAAHNSGKNGIRMVNQPHQMSHCPPVNANEYYSLMGNQNIMAQLNDMEYQRVCPSNSANGQQHTPNTQVNNIATNAMQQEYHQQQL